MTEEEISKWAKKLITRYDNVKIVGAGGEWSGDTRQGFLFNQTPSSIVTGNIPPPPTETGACCFDDGTCSVTTSSNCETLGGTYQGDGTDCTPNPCPAPGEGACCLGDGVCAIESEAQCILDGGTFQGVGTDCIPNPCPLPPCPCYFEDGGRFWRTKRYNYEISNDCPPAVNCMFFDTGLCQDPAWHCPDDFYTRVIPTSYLASETYGPDCEITQSFEDLGLTFYCNCTDTNPIFDPGPRTLCPHQPIDDCPDACINVEPPFDFQTCSTVILTITYEDECTPV